jgi:hypothetical protein
VAHFLEEYAHQVTDILHDVLGGTFFYKADLIEVPGLLSAVLITYEGVRDDFLEVRDALSWEAFLDRMTVVKADWRHFDKALMEELATMPEKTMGGWEGRTIYFIKGGLHPEQWTRSKSREDATVLLASSAKVLGPLIAAEVKRLREDIPVGQVHFREYERMVRIVLRFVSQGELGEASAQSRTGPENEGVEIRDLIFPNVAESGFWKDLKDKYSVSEVVVDAKNTEELRRDDLRQLYCYLKPALGYWGFIVCRTPQTDAIHAFNRTLHKNFRQERGVLILTDDDLRRMVEMTNRGQKASEYLQDRKSEFVRAI